jgi:hypothetical protein
MRRYAVYVYYPDFPQRHYLMKRIGEFGASWAVVRFQARKLDKRQADESFEWLSGRTAEWNSQGCGPTAPRLEEL